MAIYINPILPGFYPDPSICRAGEDYYLVNSSFAYFPAIPVFHSRDLVHWVQIGNALDRESQINLRPAGHSKGIYAPTIRYHKGIFYIVSTNVSGGGNFIISAKNPSGPWSDPHYIDADGINPSLFFDSDEKSYLLGSREKQDARYYGENEIWISEFDLETFSIKTEPYVIWQGAMQRSESTEAPHLYKKDGMYYLIAAEGGTGQNHSVVAARSKELFAPFEGNPKNPVVTHRNMGKNSLITNVGHGDLIETQKGDWYMVLLGSRPCEGYSYMGRETFLLPVIWEDGWFLSADGSASVEFYYEMPDLPRTTYPPIPACDNFDKAKLDFRWLHLRYPHPYSLTERPGFLRLVAQGLNFVSLRQMEPRYYARTAVEFVPRGTRETAGMMIMQNDNCYIRMEIGKRIRLVKCENGDCDILVERDVAGVRTYLSVYGDCQNIHFYVNDVLLAKCVDGRFLSTEAAGGFVGNCIGMFAEGNGSSKADFDYFEYHDLRQ